MGTSYKESRRKWSKMTKEEKGNRKEMMVAVHAERKVSLKELRQKLRDAFTCCPGCGRTKEQVYNDRHHPDMDMNQLLTLEHKVPRSLGGTNDPENLMVLCHRCNFTRGNQTPWNWYGEQYLVYAQGWPCPQRFYGKAGEVNARMWRDRAAAFAALLGWGPVVLEQEYGFDGRVAGSKNSPWDFSRFDADGKLTHYVPGN